MKKKRLKLIISAIIGIFVLLLLGGSYFIGRQVFEASTQVVTNDETQGVSDTFWRKYNIDFDAFINTYKIEKIELISSLDGHLIPGDYIYAAGIKSRDHDTVILVHGAGGNRLTNYPLAEYFLSRGFNVISYDQRSSGDNTARYTTFGYWEKQDLIDITEHIMNSTENKIIGYWGTSFGGATVGQALGNDDINKYIDFAILDCPVSSMKEMVTAEIKSMDAGFLTGYILQCGNIVNKMNLGFFYGDADVCKEINTTVVPALIINSENDTLTPAFMGRAIYDSIPHADKEIWTVSDSEHTEIWLDHNEEYRTRMSSFIEKHTKK